MSNSDIGYAIADIGALSAKRAQRRGTGSNRYFGALEQREDDRCLQGTTTPEPSAEYKAHIAKCKDDVAFNPTNIAHTSHEVVASILECLTRNESHIDIAIKHNVSVILVDKVFEQIPLSQQCTRCKEVKDTPDFDIIGWGKKVRLTTVCKVCEEEAKSTNALRGGAIYEEYEITEDGRKCMGCGVWQSWDMFDNHKGGINGKHSRCRSCRNARERAYRAKKRGKTEIAPAPSPKALTRIPELEKRLEAALQTNAKMQIKITELERAHNETKEQLRLANERARQLGARKRENKDVSVYYEEHRIDDKGRVCQSCKVWKEWECFGKQTSGLRGKRAHCKPCWNAKHNEYNRKRRKMIGIALRRRERCVNRILNTRTIKPAVSQETLDRCKECDCVLSNKRHNKDGFCPNCRRQHKRKQ